MDASKKIFSETWAAYEAGARTIANKGGARSGKTWTILLILLKLALSRRVLISVISESLPHLKRGAMRDFEKIIEATHMREGEHYYFNRTDNIYTFTGGGALEFFGADNSDKLHGPQRDIMFVNECNHIDFESFRQLAVRTSQTIFLDWNPTARFWFEDKGVETEADTVVIHSTYLDNPFLSPAQVKAIEANKDDDIWWKVYGLGETGGYEGLVYSRWDLVNAVPSGRSFYCVDFGFTHDPTAVLFVVLQGGELWVDELAYGPGMTNADIAEVLKANGANWASDIVCDSAEPKSIAEINAHRLNAVPATKGAGSITAGVEAVRAYMLHVTKRSLGLIDELRNYMWKRDRDGDWLNVPVDKYNHALDALRYGVTNFLWAVHPFVRPRIKTTRIV